MRFKVVLEPAGGRNCPNKRTVIKHTLGGCFDLRGRGCMMNIEKMKNQLLKRIDQDDLLEVNKIERLIMFMNDLQKCDEKINAEGISQITENGSQRFNKSHPLLNEKIKINGQIIALEKTINFISDGTEVAAATTKSVEEFTEDDLI